MKVVIAYPPLNNAKGTPTLGQNRQFQYFKEPTFIYPLVPAQAATLLKNAGHEVIWLDCVAQGMPYEDFFSFIDKEKPGLIAFETKTPVIKQLWRIIDRIKGQGQGTKIVFFGDHVTALPEESFENSQVDFVLSGGDYDFLLPGLCNYLDKAGELEPGIYYRDRGQIRNTGNFILNHDLNSVPFIDRDLTKWQLYSYKNGNYKRTPGTYIASSRDCWWGKCSFCSWPQLYPGYRSRNVDNVLDEIEVLVNKYGIREIMDDSGTFAVGPWLKDFCQGMIKRGLNKKVYIDCNMRFGALSREDFLLMKEANFRLVLFGLESVNQNTLDRINKGLKAGRILEDCRTASECGLSVHITVMFGYPWETYKEALNTAGFVKGLLKDGYAYTMQATMVVPYPGTLLFDECRKNGWLKTTDWDQYDMKSAVVNTGLSYDEISGLIREMYAFSFSGKFMLRKLTQIKDIDDLRYYSRAAKKVLGHIFDNGG